MNIINSILALALVWISPGQDLFQLNHLVFSSGFTRYLEIESRHTKHLPIVLTGGKRINEQRRLKGESKGNGILIYHRVFHGFWINTVLNG